MVTPRSLRRACSTYHSGHTNFICCTALLVEDALAIGYYARFMLNIKIIIGRQEKKLFCSNKVFFGFKRDFCRRKAILDFKRRIFSIIV